MDRASFGKLLGSMRRRQPRLNAAKIQSTPHMIYRLRTHLLPGILQQRKNLIELFVLELMDVSFLIPLINNHFSRY
jgi:hypothetical protein